MTVRLAVDTVTDRASVAVLVNGRFSAAVVLGVRQAASSLVSAIDVVLERAKAEIADVTEVIIADGPGSFTGLRIGIATIAGLVKGRDIAAWTVPSLVGTASGALSADGQSVAIMYDALRREVFAAAYALEHGRLVERLPPQLIPVAEFAKLGRPDFALGSGALAHPDVVEAWLGVRPQAGEAHETHAANLLDLERLAGCVRVCDDLAAFEPAYGRLAEAQVRWEAEHGKPLPDSTGAPG